MGKKTRRSKEKKQGDDVPPHLREFISSIGENWFPSGLKLLDFLTFVMQLWKNFRTTRRLWSARRRTSGSRRRRPLTSLGRVSDLWWPGWRYTIMMLMLVMSMIIIHFSQSYQFTDLDIMNLWNSFRIDFPEGTKAIYSLWIFTIS